MKKKAVWLSIILILAIAAGYKIKSGNKAIDVDLGKVERGSIEEYVEETGSLVLEEETAIYSESAGRIVEVAKEAGESVKAGEILVRMDSSALALQKKALEAQKLQIAAKYDEAKSSKDEEEIRRLTAQLSAEEAAYEAAKGNMDNNKVLYEAGAISLELYKSSVTKLAAAEANLDIAKSNLALAEKGISENVSRQYQAQLTEVQTKIDQLKLQSEDMVVKSPIDGIVMASEVEEGSTVQAGTKLFEIGGTNGLYIESDILIEDMSGINQNALVRIEDEDLGIKNMTGKVRKIYPKAFSKLSDLGIAQKRVKLEISLDNVAEGLLPGYDTTVKIITKSSPNTLLIPEKAVFEYQGRDHVFINDKGTAKLREIKKGLVSDDQLEVVEGLKEGEEIVLSPDDSLENGSKIE